VDVEAARMWLSRVPGVCWCVVRIYCCICSMCVQLILSLFLRPRRNDLLDQLCSKNGDTARIKDLKSLKE
jgi:uncharacterized membrane protein YheB (UPF0754 family)